MAGVTLTSSETALLSAVVEACSVEDPTTPLPWPVLELMDRLVPGDGISFCGLDSATPGTYLMQEYDDGTAGKVHVEDRPVFAAGDEPFWAHYWSSDCALPEIARDFTSVTRTSDNLSDREWWASPMRVDYLTEVRWEMMLALDDGGTRTVRLLFFRETGHDFDERERFFLTLLRPHVEHSYRSWQRARKPATSPSAAPLTPRQRELVLLVGAGLTNRQIARETGLSEATVRTHLVNIYQRLGVNNRTAAVMRVLDSAPAGDLPSQRAG